ncbi:MAG: HAMP domain-containing sensor histidine kinase [Bacteroidota bacterium]
MSLSPEAEVAETVHAFFETWMAPGTSGADAAYDLVADGFTGLGTGTGDRYTTREAVRDVFIQEKEAAEWDAVEPNYAMEWLDVRLLRPDLAVAEGQVRSTVVIGAEAYAVDPRVSMILDRGSGRWLLVHFHFSIADAVIEEGETLVEALTRRTTVLEREVAQRTAELEASLADLKAAQARLVQQEKMASLGALTAGIAHEIKNPLNFVTNFAGLSRELLDDLDTEADPAERAALRADLRANVEKIEHHGRRADGIVRAMMAHARSGGGAHQRVEVNALVEEHAAHALHADRVRHPGTEAALAFDLAADAGTVEADPQEIGRVVVNLVDNAIEAVRRTGGAVTVSTCRVEGGVEIRVADDGPGMPEAVRARVFEPFFTTKPPGEGTGLGLSLSHDVVVQGHGGRLSVESAEGEGTAFTVWLPGADAASGPGAASGP